MIRHRYRLGLSQDELSRRVAENARSGAIPGAAALSVNTIQNWERKRFPDERVPQPYAATVAAAAHALELEPGTPDHTEFLRAARATTTPHATGERETAWPDTGAFVAAGRSTHLARLDELVAHVDAWQPDIALVSGDPGTGKSSLIAEACRQAFARDSETVALWIECPRLDRTSDSFVLARQLVELLAGGARHASSRTLVSPGNRDRLVVGTARAIRTLVEQASGLIDRIVGVDLLTQRAIEANASDDVLAALRRTSDRPIAMRGESLGASEELFRLLSGYSRERPVLLVVEDLHWACERTCLLLLDLALRLRQHPARVGIVGSFRPAEVPIEGGESPHAHPLPRVMHQIAQVYPDVMLDLSTAVGGDNGRAFVERFVAQTLATVPDGFTDALYARTAGVPIIVKGLIDIFVRDGVIDTTGDTRDLTVTREPDWSAIPSTTSAMFAERLDRLSRDALHVLTCASVIGTVFHAEVLERAVSGTIATPFVDLLTEDLERHHRLVHASGPVRVAGQRVHEFRFTHEVLRDIVVRRIGDLERQRLHARIADAMRDLFGEGPHEAAATIAGHYEEANDLANAGLAWKAAGDYALRTNRFHVASGDFALSVEEFSGAVGFFSRARELIDGCAHPETLAGVILGLANCARASAQADRALELATEALDISKRHDLRVMTSHSLTSLAMLDYDTGNMESAAARLQEAGAFLPAEADDVDRARIFGLLSHAYYGMKRYESAIEAARFAYAMAERAGDKPLMLEALLGETNCLPDLGMFAESIPAYERILTAQREQRNPRGVCIALVNLALCCLEQAEWQRALGYLEQVREMTAAAFIPRIEGSAQYYRALVEEGRRRLDDADHWFRIALQTRLENSQYALAMDALAGLLRVAVDRNRRPDVVAYLADLEARLEQRGIVGAEHTIRLYLALVRGHAFLGNHDAAARSCAAAKAFLDDNANTLTGAGYRESFLLHVPAHREMQDWIARYLS
jgi:predicted ATPase/transcriptional regulator with XRE-family HTH domain